MKRGTQWKNLTAADVLFSIATATTTAGLLAIHGQSLGFVSSVATRYVEIGKVDCVAGTPSTFVNGVCPAVAYPDGAALGNGLPLALMEGAINRLPGVSGNLAIDIVNVMLMLLAVVGGIAFFRYWNFGRWLSLTLAIAYLASLGVAGMTGFGSTFWLIAALPAVMWVYLRSLSTLDTARWRRSLATVAGLGMFTAVIMFVDGYGTLFALTAVGIEACCRLVPKHTRRVAWVHLGGLGLVSVIGFVLFSLYPSSQSGWARSDLALFRSMGADLVTYVVPGPGSWWGNLVGLHGVKDLWGDGTNVDFNFMGYALIITAVVGTVLAVRSRRRVAAWAVVGFAAFLLSLGPSLKVHEVRGPLEPPITYHSYLMPPDAAVVDLPTKYAYKVVPGLTMLRATYRWHTLAHVSALVLAGYALSRWQRRGRSAAIASAAVAVVIAVEAAPNVVSALESNREGHHAVAQFGHDVALPLDDALAPGSVVVFSPGSEGLNDYLAWRLAGSGDYSSFNVGGDKALVAATDGWPLHVLSLIQGSEDFADNAVIALERGDIDAVVIPLFDLRWGIGQWPVDRQWTQRGDATLEAALADPRLTVDVQEYFAVVRLSD